MKHMVECVDAAEPGFSLWNKKHTGVEEGKRETLWRPQGEMMI